MMDFAIGAAVVPPEPLWFWRTTATATVGWSAGAKATNQVVFRVPVPPVSAVPVLPATFTPGIWAAVRVPPVTTACIIWLIASAVLGLIARLYLCGLVRTITEPPGEVMRWTTDGFMTTPSFATPPAAIAICSGVTSGCAVSGPWADARGAAPTRGGVLG